MKSSLFRSTQNINSNDEMNGPITGVVHIISDEKYYSCPMYFNFFMYIFYFVLFLIGQAPGLNFIISLTLKI